jgi:hypothetical protein
MLTQYGNVNCMSQRKVYEMVARFKSGRTSVTKLDQGTRATQIVLTPTFEKTDGLLCLKLLMCYTLALVLPVLLLCSFRFVCG